MISQWYKSGPRGRWPGRVEVIGGHTRIYYPRWPNTTDKELVAIKEGIPQINVQSGWWMPIDIDFEVDVGL